LKLSWILNDCQGSAGADMRAALQSASADPIGRGDEKQPSLDPAIERRRHGIAFKEAGGDICMHARIRVSDIHQPRQQSSRWEEKSAMMVRS
jgi:hypothetical protein